MISTQDLSTFQAVCAAHILGYKTGVVLKGTSKHVRVFQEVLDASKALYEVLNESESTMSTVTEKLNHKKIASQNFQACFGKPWVL